MLEAAPVHLRLALERRRERRRRAQPLERLGRLGDERLQPRQLLRLEGALLVDRGDRENARHALLRDHRDPRAALRRDPLDEPRARQRRAGDVEHGDRRRVEHGARDPGRLVAKIDLQLFPPGGAAALDLGVDAGRLSALIVDEHDPGEADPKERVHLANERPCDV